MEIRSGKTGFVLFVDLRYELYSLTREFWFVSFKTDNNAR